MRNVIDIHQNDYYNEWSLLNEWEIVKMDWYFDFYVFFRNPYDDSQKINLIRSDSRKYAKQG